MAQKTIPALDELTDLEDTAVFPVDDGIQTYKVTALNLAKELQRLFERSARNYAQNPAFDYFQRWSSATIANATSKYIADRWYVTNGLGAAGVLTGQSTTGVVSGSRNGIQVSVTTPPSSPLNGVISLSQALENWDALALYDKTASMSVWIKAVGNVNQIKISFVSAATVIKPTSVIGTPVTATVNSAGFTLVKIDGQALGTAMTQNGTIGFRIEVSGVSSGNYSDSGNGFIAEQVMVNEGAFSVPFHKPQMVEIFQTCQRFYERSYDLSTATGTASTQVNAQVFTRGDGSGSVSAPFKVTKAPHTLTVTGYSPISGSANEIYNARSSAGVSLTGTDGTGSNRVSFVFVTGTVAGDSLSFHFTAEAEV